MLAYLKKIDNNGVASFSPIQLGDAMSSGGEGTVYSILGEDSWKERFAPTKTIVTKRVCAKIYSDGHLRKHSRQLESKLNFMMRHRPEHLHDGPRNMIQICYPFGVLYDKPDGQFVGMLMYLALDDSVSMSIVANDKAEAYYKRLHQMGQLKKTEWEIYKKFQFTPDSQPSYARYIIVHNVASLVQYLHSTGKYVVADMKPENILITIKGGISLVDVDSIQVSYRHEKYPSLVSTFDYAPPEFHKNINSKKGFKDVSFDLFSMAVIFYKILTGTHPFCYSVKGGDKNAGTSVPEHIRKGGFACGRNRSKYNLSRQHRRFDNLPAAVKDLFTRAFEGDPQNRPTALEWKNVMVTVIKGSQKPSNGNNRPIAQKYVPHKSFRWKNVCPFCGTRYPKPASSNFCSRCGKKRE